MRYFIPDWEDRIDPNFDFENDFEPNRQKDSYTGRIYAHELFRIVPYDGILISLGIFREKIRIDNNGQHPTIRGYESIKEYLRLDKYSKQLEVMGDCGAFSYINEEKPPFSVKEITDLYNDFDFDLGISLDHLVVNSIVGNGGQKIKLSQADKEKRRQLSLENAQQFLSYCQSRNYSFIPIGSAQGYDTTSYINSVNELIEMNYEYIALGGLVRHVTPKIDEIVTSVMRVVAQNRNIKIHLLGLLRTKLLNKFKRLNIASFDSASYLRKAWLRSSMNYLGVDGNWYAAIRVPYSWNPNIRSEAEKQGINLKRLQELEEESLKTLKKYAKSEKDLKATLEVVLEYDKLLNRSSDKKNLKEKYEHTLQSRIWEKCNCEICQIVPSRIDIVIFRGANRNKRRGFHNIKMFYEQFLADDKEMKA